MSKLLTKISILCVLLILEICFTVSVENFVAAQVKSPLTQSIDRLPLQEKLGVSLQVTQRQGQQQQLNPHATAWVSVSCLFDEVVVGGGHNIVGPVGKLVITGEAKTGNGWGVRGENNSDNLAATVTPFAMCAKLVPK